MSSSIHNPLSVGLWDRWMSHFNNKGLATSKRYDLLGQTLGVDENKVTCLIRVSFRLDNS